MSDFQAPFDGSGIWEKAAINNKQRRVDAVRARGASLIHFVFPALKEGWSDKKGTGTSIDSRPRLVDTEDYIERSSISKLADPYVLFVVRRLHMLKDVKDKNEKFLVAVANKTRKQLEQTNKNFDKKVLDDTLEQMLYSNEYSLDAVFGDLWRLLFEKSRKFPFHKRSEITDLLRNLYMTPMFAEIKEQTTGDPINSTLMAVHLMELGEMQQAFADAMSDQIKKNKKMGEAGDGDGDGEETKEGKCGAGSDSAAQKAMQDADKAKSRDKDLDNMAGHLAGSEYVKPDTTLERLNHVMKMVEQYLHPNSHGTRDRLKKVFDTFGRLSSIFVEAFGNSRIGDGEMMSITQGAELDSMLGSEYVRFAMLDGLSDAMAAKRIQEAELAIQKRQGLEDVGNGPILLFLDISSSMTSYCTVDVDGAVVTSSKLDIAASLAYSLVTHAKDSKRAIVVMPFNGDLCRNNISVFEFNKSNMDAADIQNKLITCLGMEAYGGTSFRRALKGAAEYLKKEKAVDSFEHADIIFFSDGAGDAPRDKKQISDIRKTFPEGTRLFGFFVEGGNHNVKYIEEANNVLFDVVKAVNGSSSMKDALQGFLISIIEHGTYSRITEQR